MNWTKTNIHVKWKIYTSIDYCLLTTLLIIIYYPIDYMNIWTLTNIRGNWRRQISIDYCWKRQRVEEKNRPLPNEAWGAKDVKERVVVGITWSYRNAGDVGGGGGFNEVIVWAVVEVRGHGLRGYMAESSEWQEANLFKTVMVNKTDYMHRSVLLHFFTEMFSECWLIFVAICYT